MTIINSNYECLIELYRERNITRAARRLGLQQPGLSKLLKRMEEDFGRPLFERQKDGLLPTEFAHRLVPEILKLKDQWDSSFQGVLEQEGQIAGEFTICSHPIIASTYLSKPFSKLQQTYPALGLELRLNNSVEACEAVAAGEADFAIAANPLKRPHLVIQNLATEFVALWVNGEMRENQPLFFNPEMINVHSALRKLDKMRFVPISDYNVINTMVSSMKDQAALLPSSIAEKNPALEQVGKPLYKTDIGLVYRVDTPKTRAFRAVVEALRDI
ncbi:MAG TPA: LysR family transcriptional regulator [Bdellovibrionales bacterium]|nr:LysR family transcriptional regulator [Bdellovibrionales bacterium]